MILYIMLAIIYYILSSLLFLTEKDKKKITSNYIDNHNVKR